MLSVEDVLIANLLLTAGKKKNKPSQSLQFFAKSWEIILNPGEQ